MDQDDYQIQVNNQSLLRPLTLPMLRLFLSKVQRHKDFFENHLNPAMLVFIE